jgi:hypothetical protein
MRKLTPAAGGNVVNLVGVGDLIVDSWGVQKVSTPFSLFHGLWTFDVPPSMWLAYVDGAEVSVAAAAASGAAASVDGALVLDSTGINSVEITSRRSPRYQPNRGHLYSTSCILPNPTADCTREFGLFTDDNGVFFRLKSDGYLYAVLRSGGVETFEERITLPAAVDLSKGNIFDIQFQWRGVGNYFFYVGNPTTGQLELTHTLNHLGKYDTLSIQNPALPTAFKVISGTEAGVLKSGCVDLTSEAGALDREQYGSAVGSCTASTNTPIIAIRNPFQISGRLNTRDVRITQLTLSADKRTTVSMWLTRDPTAFTGASWTANNDGSLIEFDDTATAVDTAKCKFVTQFVVEANVTLFASNPNPQTIDFFMSRGDYVLLLGSGSSSNITGVIAFGEEI